MVDLNQYGYGVWADSQIRRFGCVQTNKVFFTHSDSKNQSPIKDGKPLLKTVGWRPENKIAGGELTEW